MTQTSSKIYAPGEKGHRDENFPVASRIIAGKYRGAVLSFYRFARAADDVADDPALSEEAKIMRLDRFEATLLGRCDDIAAAVQLRGELARHRVTARHALDLLVAFRQDARKHRYADWEELMQYCAYSAAPVGRFVLDLHGESAGLWPASDALCAALQVINHLQDCKADYLRLNRVYIPQNALARHASATEELAAARASGALRACLAELAGKTQLILARGMLSPHVQNLRLAMEVAAIEALARKLVALLRARDPLSQRVHLSKPQALLIMLTAALRVIGLRAWQRGGACIPAGEKP